MITTRRKFTEAAGNPPFPGRRPVFLAMIVALLPLAGCATKSPEAVRPAKCEIVPVAGTPAVREVCGEGSAYRIRTWYPVAFTPPPIYGLPGADSDPRPPKVVVVTE